jgi:hypothetical protein
MKCMYLGYAVLTYLLFCLFAAPSYSFPFRVSRIKYTYFSIILANAHRSRNHRAQVGGGGDGLWWGGDATTPVPESDPFVVSTQVEPLAHVVSYPLVVITQLF